MIPYVFGVLGLGALALASIAVSSKAKDPLPPDDQTDEVPVSVHNGNLQAMMAVIREGESSDNYNALVGGGEFVDMTDHPSHTGEWGSMLGVDISPVGCGAKYNMSFHGGIRLPSGDVSTAAGAYQITRMTWCSMDGINRFGGFNPQQQDEACIFLINRRKAMAAVMAGDIEHAVVLLRNEWEFFQKWDLERVKNAFVNNGGVLA
jgi:muramidase (phage lysozyme)